MDLLDKMATYVRVVEAGNFSAAAKQLKLSGAAVSRQIAALEGSLHTDLLRRSTRRMAVTPAGRRYYERCLRVLREVDAAQSVGQDQALAGLLQITAPVSFGLARVVPHLQTLMAKHRNLRLDLRLEDRLLDLALEGVDVAIRVGSLPPDSLSLIAHRLFEFRRVLVAAPGYLARHGQPTTPEALGKHEALSHPATDATDSWTLVNGERVVQVGIRSQLRCNALHALRDLSLAGAGIAWLPPWFADEHLRSGALRTVLPGWTSAPITVDAIHRATDRGAPRTRAFVEHLRSAYAPDREHPARAGPPKAKAR